VKELPSVTDTGTAESTVPSVGLGQTPLRWRFSGAGSGVSLVPRCQRAGAPPPSGRAQSVPKRSGTSRLLLARCGTKGQFKGCTNCLTSPLARIDKAAATAPKGITGIPLRLRSYEPPGKHMAAVVAENPGRRYVNLNCTPPPSEILGALARPSVKYRRLGVIKSRIGRFG